MNAVTTPTCLSCGTKFPGRDSCVKCGRDPNAAPSPIEKALAKVDPADHGRRRALKRSIGSAPTRRRRKHGR